MVTIGRHCDSWKKMLFSVKSKSFDYLCIPTTGEYSVQVFGFFFGLVADDIVINRGII